MFYDKKCVCLIASKLAGKICLQKEENERERERDRKKERPTNPMKQKMHTNCTSPFSRYAYVYL